MSRRVGANRQGEFQGAMGSLQGLSGLIGPVIFSGSFAYVTSSGAVWKVLSVQPLLVSAWCTLPYPGMVQATRGPPLSQCG